MALRRPPTRVELKADDIDEYEQVNLKTNSVLAWLCHGYEGNPPLTYFSCCSRQLMNERMMAAADTSPQVSTPTAAATNTRQAAKDAKKASAAERIGINGRRR